LLCWCLAACFGAPQVFAADLGPGVEAVQRCIEQNLPAHSSRQQVVFERGDRAGNERRFEATIWWKRDAAERSRLLARVEEPPDERGTGFLVIEGETGTDMFSYLPELGRVRRVTSRTASGFLGTDLSFEDLEELQNVGSRASVERQPDATLDGRPVYVLVGRPAADSASAYARVVSHVDRETCVPLKTSFEDPDGRPVKELEVAFSDVTKQGERWFPRKATFRNVANESQTRLTLQKIEFEVEIPDRLFTQGELAKGN
jgi:outer membrane lipoprotein-sorting protein